MRLTPLDIRKQEFKRTMRGYDREEVNTFLEMLAEEFEALLKEKNQQHEENIKIRTQLHDYQEIERTLKHALKNAQDTAQQSLENSKREAEMTVHGAELEADKVLHDAKIKLQELKNELIVVRAQKDSFARRLRHLLESQLELIGVLEMDDLGFGEPDPPSQSASARERTIKPGTHAPASEPPQRITSARHSTQYDGVKPLPKSNETVRNSSSQTDAPAGNNARTTSRSDFRPVVEATNSIKTFPKDKQQKDSQDTRISDHFIT